MVGENKMQLVWGIVFFVVFTITAVLPMMISYTIWNSNKDSVKIS